MIISFVTRFHSRIGSAPTPVCGGLQIEEKCMALMTTLVVWGKDLHGGDDAEPKKQAGERPEKTDVSPADEQLWLELSVFDLRGESIPQVHL